MGANDELYGFVKEAMARGAAPEQIRGALVDAGWDESRVRQALAAYDEGALGIPVPRPRPSEAREALVYLVLFATMYLSAFNLGNVAFQLVNRGFPVAGQSDVQVDDAIRLSASILVVSLPVFLVLTRATRRAIERDPSRRASAMRRWLTSLTLAVSSFACLGVFSTIVYNFLGDALTARFVLKALSAGIIAAGVFAYYLRDIREDAAP